MAVSSCRKCFRLIILFQLLLFIGCYAAQRNKITSGFPFRYKKGTYHTVRRGQTLWAIAKTYNVSVTDITMANGISDPDKIEIGQRLFIPKAYKSKKITPTVKKSPPQKPTKKIPGLNLFGQ